MLSQVSRQRTGRPAFRRSLCLGWEDAQEGHAGGRCDMFPGPTPDLETELTFGSQEITRKANWVFSLSKSCYEV